MAQNLREELAKHKLLLILCVFSFLLLLIFLISQDNDVKMLRLEIKWLVISGIPILIGLFIGGYIKNFKGFGLELEYNLKEPIPLTVISKINMDVSPGLTKATINQLNQLTAIEKESINRLRFIYGKQDYYSAFAVMEHFEVLENLEFIEVVNDKGEFKFVISVTRLKKNDSSDSSTGINRVREFITEIANENFNNLLPVSVTDYILTTDSTIEAYRKIKKSLQASRLFPEKDVLPVLNDKREMIGTVDKQKLEANIAEEVEKQIP